MDILLAEDEKAMSMAVSAVLNHSGYNVDPAYDGQEAVEKAQNHPYDCMIFDVMMPRKDGITALQELRQSGNTTPVILLTAKSEVDDKISGLDAGADDYLTKPFAMGELLARIRSMVRRNQKDSEALHQGSVTLKVGEGELSCKSAVRLSAKETQLMKVLMMNPDKECSTEMLFDRVWDKDEQSDSGIVWIYVSYLREKLNAIGGDLRIDGKRGGSFKLCTQGA
jgi:DNA-binding response OmpR family regulator